MAEAPTDNWSSADNLAWSTGTMDRTKRGANMLLAFLCVCVCVTLPVRGERDVYNVNVFGRIFHDPSDVGIAHELLSFKNVSLILGA